MRKLAETTKRKQECKEKKNTEKNVASSASSHREIGLHAWLGCRMEGSQERLAQAKVIQTSLSEHLL
jgi:hypothetical protein